MMKSLNPQGGKDAILYLTQHHSTMFWIRMETLLKWNLTSICLQATTQTSWTIKWLTSGTKRRWILWCKHSGANYQMKTGYRKSRSRLQLSMLTTQLARPRPTTGCSWVVTRLVQRTSWMLWMTARLHPGTCTKTSRRSSERQSVKLPSCQDSSLKSTRSIWRLKSLDSRWSTHSGLHLHHQLLLTQWSVVLSR